MTFITTIFVYFLNLINCFMKRNYKPIIFLMIILLWILMGASIQNPDIQAYQMSYSNTNIIDLEIGYWILERIFVLLGFNYRIFRLIVSGIGLLLIHSVVKKNIKNESCFYIVYFIFPFLFDVVQVKNFLGMAIFIYSIQFLIKKDKSKLFVFVFLILLSASIQISFIVFLPLALFVNIKKDIFFKLILLVGIGLIIIISLFPSFLKILSNILIKSFNAYDTRVSIYAHKQTNLGFLLFWFFQFVNFGLLYWAYKIIKYTNISIKNNKKFKNTYNYEYKSKYVKLILWINIYAFSFLPLYVFHSTFFRLMRNIIPLNLLAYIHTNEIMLSNKYSKLLFNASYVSFHIFLFYIKLCKPYSENIIKPVLEFNWVLNIFQ